MSSSVGGAAGDGTRGAPARDDLRRLVDLVDCLQDRLPTRSVDDRELELVGGAVTPAIAAQQLRAITALLVTLDSYQRQARRPAVGGASPRPVTALAPQVVPPHRNGSQPADTADPGLAAATARYIARDLAARRLSEFTSAEGYRLARALARIGGVEQAVEELLGEANDIRLHPVSLTDALSHSSR